MHPTALYFCIIKLLYLNKIRHTTLTVQYLQKFESLEQKTQNLRILLEKPCLPLEWRKQSKEIMRPKLHRRRQRRNNLKLPTDKGQKNAVISIESYKLSTISSSALQAKHYLHRRLLEFQIATSFTGCYLSQECKNFRCKNGTFVNVT